MVLLDWEIVLPMEVLVMVVVFEVVVVMPEPCFGEEHIFDALVILRLYRFGTIECLHNQMRLSD